MNEFPQLDSSLVVLVFTQEDDPIACLNKAMAFLSAVAALRQGKSYTGAGYKGNATSSGRNNTGGQARVVKCYNYQGEGHMARKCTQPKRPRNTVWFKEKAMLAEAQESGQILDEEQLSFLADPSIRDGQATQKTIPNTVAFQIEDLDAYDSDCDDVFNSKAVLITNLSNYGSDVILEEKANQEKNNESLTAELERYIERVKTFEQRLNIDLSTREKMIDPQMDDMIKEKLALKQQIDSLEHNLSNQIKEKESLLQTFTVFKNESKEKESKYMDKEINLEKKIKELDNIVYKVGQSAQTVHIDIDFGRSQSKMLAKQNDLISKEKKINTTLVNYVELNRLSKDFGKCFVPQQELFVEQAFWLQTSHPNTDQYDISPVKIKAPKELPKTLKDIFNVFDKELLNEVTEVQTVFNQMEAAIQQYVMLCVMNFTAIFGDTVNLEMKKSESCNKCLDLEAELVKFNKKVVVITSLKNALRKLKGKEIVENAAQIPIATTIAPGMFKLDLDLLAPRIAKNSEPNHSWDPMLQMFHLLLLLSMTSCPDCSLVIGLRILKTYDRKPLSAHELR
ncbi:integrase, catalytic region, zinc finger, CCHC-type containing protein [Tanacetum coccineum]|uniref:Integrase, catalytic region, zinc finger, CCHC-type containing protein n=1 Tax=Tanacetum coccineum TaxID=301880 RepID=A0ABQ5DVE7_9ASTR